MTTASERKKTADLITPEKVQLNWRQREQEFPSTSALSRLKDLIASVETGQAILGSYLFQYALLAPRQDVVTEHAVVSLATQVLNLFRVSLLLDEKLLSPDEVTARIKTLDLEITPEVQRAIDDYAYYLLHREPRLLPGRTTMDWS